MGMKEDRLRGTGRTTRTINLAVATYESTGVSSVVVVDRCTIHWMKTRFPHKGLKFLSSESDSVRYELGTLKVVGVDVNHVFVDHFAIENYKGVR